MHLSIEIPTPPPFHSGPRLGNVGDFYGIWRHGSPVGVGDFSGFALHIHRARSGSEVEIGLVPSFHTVIPSRGHWCRSLDFDRPRFISALCSFVSTSGFERQVSWLFFLLFRYWDRSFGILLWAFLVHWLENVIVFNQNCSQCRYMLF